ncbi:Hypothetical protein A7982_08401 [Minicystis rosea]|nr:Hypothetical protein A7982_08401 [Minicystis rosea]
MQTNGSNGAGLDGKARARAPVEKALPPAPDRVRDLAEGCVRFVERALGVKLDYEPETLPLLDHWVAAARPEAGSKPETAAVVAHAAGAYFGEVVRRRYPSWWRTEGDDPGMFRIELEPVYLSFSPMQLVADALFHSEIENETLEQLELDDADREAVTARLAELPPVSEEEFFSLATRLEVIDIAIDAIRARRLADEDGDAALGPDDYEG